MSVGAVHGLVAKDVISTLIPTNGTKALWVEDIKRERERDVCVFALEMDNERRKREENGRTYRCGVLTPRYLILNRD